MFAYLGKSSLSEDDYAAIIAAVETETDLQRYSTLHHGCRLLNRVPDIVTRLLANIVYPVDPSHVFAHAIFGSLLAHDDMLRTAAINFPLRSPADCFTFFFEKSDLDITTTETARLYTRNGKSVWPTEADRASKRALSYSAGDMYLLDVSQPHGVYMPEGAAPRYTVSINLYEPYEFYLDLHRAGKLLAFGEGCAQKIERRLG